MWLIKAHTSQEATHFYKWELFTRIGLIYTLNNNSIKEDKEYVSFLTLLKEKS